MSRDIRIPFDMREVLARIVDGSRISEFKPQYGSTLVTAFGKIMGMPIGILANNGVFFSEAANKGTQFIQLCNQSNVPILFMHNITGFMVGKKYEQEGIIKNGAKIINAISNSGVPAITVNVAASYGAGNYGMSGRAYKPRFLFSWVNSQCAVMGAEQLSGVLDIILQQSLARSGKKMDEAIQKMAEERCVCINIKRLNVLVRKEAMKKQIEEEGSVWYTSSRMIDDGVIDPRDTR